MNPYSREPIEKRVQIFLDPEKHGYKICEHCNGYGSSLKEEAPICTKCDGIGLVKETP